MARIIPNDNSWIAFTTTAPGGSSGAWTADTTLIDGATVLTNFVISINASSQGNTGPTPAIDTLFESSIIGTSSATFTADFYRDDTSDTAFTTLPRGTKGYFLISRFGGDGTNQKPIAGDVVEVWPVTVVSRTSSAMSSNTVQTFTLTASVTAEPSEAVTVTSGSAAPSVVPNLTAVRLNTTPLIGTASINLDWDVPAYVGTLANGSTEALTPYVIQVSTTATGTFNTVNQLTSSSLTAASGSVHVDTTMTALATTPTTPVTSAGIAFATSQGSSKTLYFRVAARNATGVGTYSNVVSVANVSG